MSYGNYPDLSRVQKILVIKMRHLGDVLLATPVISSLHCALPAAQIDVLVNKEAESIVSGHTGVGNIFLYDRDVKKRGFFRRLLAEYRLLASLKGQGYDLVINLTEGDRGLLTGWLLKAPVRVGFEPGRSLFSWKRSLLTHRVKWCPTPRHTVERDLDTLRCLGLVPEKKELFFSIPKEAVSRVEELLTAHGIDKFILIQPTSRWHFKSPPAETFQELIRTLCKRKDKVVVTAGPDSRERAFAARLMKGVDQSLVLDLSGLLSLKELGALIKRADALITVDSLALHLASAIQTPTVALFGPTSEVIWGPWGNERAEVVVEPLSCRPCQLDGCGGSKISDCLLRLPIKKILDALTRVKQQIS